jgi:hypothetical protein
MKQIDSRNLPLTSGFVQLGRDVAAIISSVYPSFTSGKRN